MNNQSKPKEPSVLSKFIASTCFLLGGMSLAEAHQTETTNLEQDSKLFVSAGFAWNDSWSDSLQHNIGVMVGKTPSQDSWAPLFSYQHLKYSELDGVKPSLQTYMVGASYGLTDNISIYFSGGIGDYRYENADSKALALGTGILANVDVGLTLSGGFETSLVESHTGQLTHFISRIGWSF